MKGRPSLLISITLRVLIVGACVAGIWNSVKVTRADFLFHRDTTRALQSAIRLEPDAWEYYMRLAELDEDHAAEWLETALSLNPFNAQADIELALRAEADGDAAKAEKLLLEAFAVDDTYVPRWSLAGFYFRRGNMEEFWRWARKAVEMPADNIGGLFELCWHTSTNPEEIAGKILNDNPDVIRQYLAFLLRKDQLSGAGAIADRLVKVGMPAADRPILFSVANRMLTTGDADGADTLWRSLIEQRWVDGRETPPYNAAFAQDPLPVGFDWALPSYPGVRSWTGQSGLETEFTGLQPEDCLIAEQAVILSSGSYTMEYAYQTTGILPDTGIQWQIVDMSSGAVLASSPYLSSETRQQAAMRFVAEKKMNLLHLRLVYKRVPGTSRVSGTLVSNSTQIEKRS